MNFHFLILEKAKKDVDLGEPLSALNEIQQMKLSTYVIVGFHRRLFFVLLVRQNCVSQLKEASDYLLNIFDDVETDALISFLAWESASQLLSILHKSQISKCPQNFRLLFCVN